MENRFKQELELIFSLCKHEHIILAVSGGVDSVVMAHLFANTEHDFSVAHCNFQLRDADSDADEDFVKDLAKSFNVKFYTQRFETMSYAQEHGISIQMAARDLRYNWFQDLTSQRNAIIATAHHANDTAETVLFNLVKGTGLAGLHGISKIRDSIIRPILWAGKREIVEFAKDKGLSWREDLTNESEHYHRNLIRRQVVPLLESINPSFIKAVNKTSSRICEVEELIQYTLNLLEIKLADGEKILFDLAVLRKLPALSTVLFELLNEYGFSYDQAQRIGTALDSVGAIFYSKEWMLNIDRKYLILEHGSYPDGTALIFHDDISKELDNSLYRIKRKPAKQYTIQTSELIAALDAEKLSFPLQIRYVREGDSFHPLGMTGKKKLSDFLIDIKMPVIDKRKQQVIVSGTDIVWVVGQRIDNRYRIVKKTREVLEIRVD